MGTGITLIVIGAILALALKTDSPWLNLHVVGVILILGGAGFLWRGKVRRREVVVAEDTHGAETEHTVVERDIG